MAMTETDPELAVEDVVGRGDVVMLTSASRTRDPLGNSVGAPGLEARPVTAAEVMGDRVSILVSISAPWVADIAADGEQPVVLTLDRDGRYAALSGTATVDDDTARVVRMWSHAAEAFVSGPEDPEVRVLDVEVAGGEWWRAPTGGIGTALSLVGQIVLGRPAHSGARGPVVTDGEAGSGQDA
jgi:general stress protein 26